jgi:type III secretory pathway component EscS
MQIAHGPLSIVIGLAAGILLGFVCALTPIWSSPLSRAAALLVMGELMAFYGWVYKSHLINGSNSQLAGHFRIKSNLCGF